MFNFINDDMLVFNVNFLPSLGQKNISSNAVQTRVFTFRIIVKTTTILTHDFVKNSAGIKLYTNLTVDSNGPTGSFVDTYTNYYGSIGNTGPMGEGTNAGLVYFGPGPIPE